MATVKISDLRSPLPAAIDREEEFVGAVSSAVIRALDARQLQEIRGGIYLEPIIAGNIPIPNVYEIA